MINTLLGIKGEQTQRFLENGRRIPVTSIQTGGNVVVGIKQVNGDTSSVKLGLGTVKTKTKKSSGKPVKTAKTAHRYLRETKAKDVSDMPPVGQTVDPSAVFQPGDLIAVTGTSKGKGFAGVVKRYHFRGGPKTHGQSDRHRSPGSIGQTTTPGRVYRGKRMAGHMGVEQVTVKNLTVVDIDIVSNTLFVLGLVPGHKNGLLKITKEGSVKKFVPLIDPSPNPQTQTPPSDEQQPVETAAAPAPQTPDAPQKPESIKPEPALIIEAAPAKEEKKNEETQKNVNTSKKEENNAK
jgi:large subunit ribosomal protein L3